VTSYFFRRLAGETINVERGVTVWSRSNGAITIWFVVGSKADQDGRRGSDTRRPPGADH
jgi:hypothetical protein